MKSNENTLKAGTALCLSTDSTPHSISRHILKTFLILFTKPRERADAKAMSATQFPWASLEQLVFSGGRNQPVASKQTSHSHPQWRNHAKTKHGHMALHVHMSTSVKNHM
jgi:hypothetical protein